MEHIFPGKRSVSFYMIIFKEVNRKWDSPESQKKSASVQFSRPKIKSKALVVSSFWPVVSKAVYVNAICDQGDMLTCTANENTRS